MNLAWVIWFAMHLIMHIECILKVLEDIPEEFLRHPMPCAVDTLSSLEEPQLLRYKQGQQYDCMLTM